MVCDLTNINVKVGLALVEFDIHQDLALLLIESEASLQEPPLSGIQTIITCSPDRRRYKEFYKNGAMKPMDTFFLTFCTVKCCFTVWNNVVENPPKVIVSLLRC